VIEELLVGDVAVGGDVPERRNFEQSLVGERRRIDRRLQRQDVVGPFGLAERD
jgi:hypothetical protein